MNFASNNLIPLLPSKLFKFKTLIVAVLEEEVEEDHFVVEDKEEEMCQVKIQAHSKEEEEELVEVTMEEEEPCRGKPAISFVLKEKLNLWVLEDYKKQKWADTIQIPLPSLKKYPNLKIVPLLYFDADGEIMARNN
ncbi:hypothetical protein POM88_024854 [Heracleum sosnowskyi]|uniref:F-box associated domain-containing protein n=1 Tax=Heracleum sosnowskyi TaxID=360622 RepID=A0AAD8I3U1_9APIA|nr:hypothetical protein POM88_024854 [Heracleum sosnowskyi]